MEKAILIIDMPNCCGDCLCFKEKSYDLCGATNRKTDIHSKPDWCPLLSENKLKGVLNRGEEYGN